MTTPTPELPLVPDKIIAAPHFHTEDKAEWFWIILIGSAVVLVMLVPQLIKKARTEKALTLGEHVEKTGEPYTNLLDKIGEQADIIGRLEYDIKERDEVIARLNANNDTLEQAVRQAIAEERERAANAAIAAEHARMAGDVSFSEIIAEG